MPSSSFDCSSSKTGRLEFKISQLQTELESLSEIAINYDFISRIGTNLDLFITRLLTIAKAPANTLQSWQIPQPYLWLGPSGDYDAKPKQATKRLLARIRINWELCPKGGVSGSPGSRIVSAAGLAVTEATLFYEEDLSEPIAKWTMEIGNPDSPGSFFHTQIKLGPDPPFPNCLSVPRWPFIVATPAAAIEFVLGELYHKNWEKAVDASSDTGKSWAGAQKRRIQKLLRAQTRRLDDVAGSPWMQLKAWKPEADLFIE